MPIHTRAPLALLPLLCATGLVQPAAAQSSITVYGRVDLSAAQQADATSNTELRNGSASRLGLKGEEDLGDGLRALFHLEHRFNADTGTQAGTRMWEGKSIVGLQSRWGRVVMGREENPAFTHSQWVADPWGGDTVASNGHIVNGRIGSTRYSNSVHGRFTAGSFTGAVQMAERDDNLPAGGMADDRPWSLGLAWSAGPLTLGLGHENPADRDDRWTTMNAAWNLGVVKLGVLFGEGRNVTAHKHRAWLATAVAPLGRGELRTSLGELENRSLGLILDRQAAVGYFHPLSKRTTLYANVVHEGRDDMPADRKATGWDLGIKHNF